MSGNNAQQREQNNGLIVGKKFRSKPVLYSDLVNNVRQRDQQRHYQEEQPAGYPGQKCQEQLAQCLTRLSDRFCWLRSRRSRSFRIANCLVRLDGKVICGHDGSLGDSVCDGQFPFPLMSDEVETSDSRIFSFEHCQTNARRCEHQADNCFSVLDLAASDHLQCR